MIATMTMQSSRMAQPQDRRFSAGPNTASAALPLIPRRTSSSRPTLSPSSSMPLPVRSSSSMSSYPSSSSSTTIMTTPSQEISSSSSTSSDGSRPTIRTRRMRGVGAVGTVCPPEMSTPIPTLTIHSSPSDQQHVFPSKSIQPTQHTQPKPFLYAPGMSLRPHSSTSRDISESKCVAPSFDALSLNGSRSASALYDTFEESRMVRKKSGQVVKSSLKSSRSSSRSGSLSVFTASSINNSKSEPTTPTSKAVHFDPKLEHVKLFLAEQKPLAVSRDGSPTDDTSGTDSDFPRFIFGGDQASGDNNDRRLPKRKVVMQVANMPARLTPCMEDVALEDLCLAPDGASILGKVRVRNLAFNKWVAVRFTFDLWQTTSEVTGKYFDSPSPQFDRFSFAIRLNDMLARIEGKTLLLAVRYSVEGREMWDNNGGQNYLMTFSKVKVEDHVQRASAFSDDEASTDMVDLRTKLEKVVNSKDRTGPAFVSQQLPPSSASWNSGSRGLHHQYSASVDPDATSFRTSSSFASRYDFAESLKRPWNPDANNMVHSRTQSFPLSRPSSSIPWPQKSPSDPYALRRTHAKQYVPKTLGSPRDLSEDVFQVESPREDQQAAARGRNHQRGYFDVAPPLSSSLRRTPAGVPASSLETAPARYNSFPPMESPAKRHSAESMALTVPEYTDSSELSTPSMVTPSSSRESTPSPSPIELSQDPNMSPDTHYRYFLNKFCFFTGPGSEFEDAELPRTHSASDIEEFLSGIPSEGHELLYSSHSRSSSLDDIALNRSGSLTPTMSRLGLAPPAITLTTPSTPVLS